MLLEPMQARLRAWMDRAFIEREVILRVDGRLSCFTLSRRRQMRIAAVGLGMCAWALLGTAAFVVDQLRVAGLSGQVEDARLAATAAAANAARARSSTEQLRAENVVLRSELAEDGEQFASLVRRLDPLGLIEGRNARADVYEIMTLADALRRSATGNRDLIEHAMLRERVAGVADELGRVAGLHFAFTHEIAGLRARIAAAESERQRLAATLETVNGMLRSSEAEQSEASGRAAYLEGAVTSLRSQLLLAERMNDELLSDSRRIEADLAAERTAQTAAKTSTARMVDYPMNKLWAGNAPEDALVLAVMRHESAFRIDAVSPAGALGIMQIMPATAAYVAGRLKLGYDPSRLIGDPDFNITIGRAYLEHLLELFDGSYVLAVAGYNAGPNRVLEWIDRFGDPRRNGVDTRAWIDSIPFAETRLYVRRVLRSLDLYRQRLAAAPADQCTAGQTARALVYASQ